MKTFRCKYRDIKNPWDIREETIRAKDESQAFEQFVKARRQDRWSLSEIFVHSHIQIVAVDTKEVFIIDSHGEVKKPQTLFPV